MTNSTIDSPRHAIIDSGDAKYDAEISRAVSYILDSMSECAITWGQILEICESPSDIQDHGFIGDEFTDAVYYLRVMRGEAS